MLFCFLLSISQMMALIRCSVTPTIWGNCARWMFKFYCEYFFHSSEIFDFFFLIRTKILPHPLRSELTSFIILHHNSIHIGMTTTTISRHLTTHLASGGPRQFTLVDYQQKHTRSSQQYKKLFLV